MYSIGFFCDYTRKKSHQFDKFSPTYAFESIEPAGSQYGTQHERKILIAVNPFVTGQKKRITVPTERSQPVQYGYYSSFLKAILRYGVPHLSQ